MGLKITDRPPTPTPGNPPLTLAHLLSEPPSDVRQPQMSVPSILEPAKYPLQSCGGGIRSEPWILRIPTEEIKGFRPPSPGYERHHVSLLQQLQQERANLLRQWSSVQHSGFTDLRHQHLAFKDSSAQNQTEISAGNVCRTSQGVSSLKCANLLSEVANGDQVQTQQPIKRIIMAESSHFLHATVRIYGTVHGFMAFLTGKVRGVNMNQS